MRLDGSAVPSDGKRVLHIRVDRIAGVGGAGLWWVAQALDDGSAKPEGMFVDRSEAMSLAEELAAASGLGVVVNEDPCT